MLQRWLTLQLMLISLNLEVKNCLINKLVEGKPTALKTDRIFRM